MDPGTRPRLCHLRKWPDFNGYGFNLHAEKGKAGQYIGTIDPQSPSEAAGLKPGDRIVEVNGVNIGSENHQQVVQRIKSVPNETRLLVVDAETDNFYRSRGMVVKSDSGDVEFLDTPMVNPYTDGAGRWNSSGHSPTISNASENQDGLHSNSQPFFPSDPPRLCRLIRWHDFDGFGFNLHSEKGKPGQFIGKVDEGSPAEAAGVRKGDWIVEVNGINVMNNLHPEVVAKIKSNPGEVSLLVVDSATEKQYKEHGIVMTGSLPEVVRIDCPRLNPLSSDRDENHVNGSSRYNANEGSNEAKDGSDAGSIERVSQHSSIESVPREAAEPVRLALHDDKDTREDKEQYTQRDNNNDSLERASKPTPAAGHADHSAAGQTGYSSFGSSLNSSTLSASNTAVSSGFSHGSGNVTDYNRSASSVSSSSSYQGGQGGVSYQGGQGGISYEVSGGKPVTVGGIEFAGSAKEAREKMRGKKNVKTGEMSAKDKYNLLQQL